MLNFLHLLSIVFLNSILSFYLNYFKKNDMKDKKLEPNFCKEKKTNNIYLSIFVIVDRYDDCLIILE